MRPSPLAIVVHGGAGLADPEREPQALAGCERAARTGYAVLESGGSALDAVERAVRDLEDDPEFNAGYGSALTRAGTIEVDACIMDGRELRAGAVGAVPWLRHPVTLARRVLEEGSHVLLVGEGALAFAREHGIEPETPGALVTERARERHPQATERARSSTPPRETSGGTVGACALDSLGHVAAATSTGGMSGKSPGRVGDSPIVGAGTLADDEAGAASATGHGEAILRVVMSKFALDQMRAGASARAAAQAAVAELARRVHGEGGIIVLARDGSVGCASSAPRMAWASLVDGRLASGTRP